MTTQVLNLPKFNGSALNAKWSTIDPIGNKLDGTLQDISAYHLPRSFVFFSSLFLPRSVSHKLDTVKRQKSSI